jgi:hypothetical protein
MRRSKSSAEILEGKVLQIRAWDSDMLQAGVYVDQILLVGKA